MLWSPRPPLLWSPPRSGCARHRVCGGISFYPHARPGAGGVVTLSSGLRVQGGQRNSLSPQLLLLASRTAHRSAISAARCATARRLSSGVTLASPRGCRKKGLPMAKWGVVTNLCHPTRSCVRRAHSVKTVARSRHELGHLFQLQLRGSSHVLTVEPRGRRGVPSQRAASIPRPSSTICGRYSHLFFVRIPSLA